MPIQCIEKELVSRTNKVSNLLLPITGAKIAGTRIVTPARAVIIGAYSGTKVTDNYTDWRFKTINTLITGNYFEIWSQVHEKEYRLEKAYLKIMEKDKEILSLHCDPTIQLTDRKYKYKCGPHIHVKHPNEQISNAHISLNLRDFTQIISSLKEFELGYGNAITMIKDEFLLHE